MLNSKSKILESDLNQIESKIAHLKQPLAFTNGCFDILHRGHVSYLESARNLGGSLIVGVNSDASVKRQNKGEDRPINSIDDRLAILAALECVDAVIAFEDDTPLKLIKAINPQILVKGGDWPIGKIVGADHVINHGGEVHSIDFEFNRSTTKLLNKIRQHPKND